MKMYTAQEMRDMAEQILHTDDDWYEDAGYMLRQAADEVERIRAENARLKAALKPVLDAYISQDDPSEEVYDSRLDAAVCVRAVREAKRIYKGGAK